MATCDLYHWDWALPLAPSSSFQNNRLTFTLELPVSRCSQDSSGCPSLLVAEEVCGDFAEIQVEATTVSLVNGGGRRRFGLAKGMFSCFAVPCRTLAPLPLASLTS